MAEHDIEPLDPNDLPQLWTRKQIEAVIAEATRVNLAELEAKVRAAATRGVEVARRMTELRG